MADASPDTAHPRQALRAARRAIPPAERLLAADGVARALLDLPFAPQTGYVAGYWANDGELPLHAWQLRLPPGCSYCLPVLDEDASVLRFAPFRPGDPVAPNRFGIPEPVWEPGSLLSAADLALIVLPLTGFDSRCHRLGMGGGWYDRTLAGHRAAPPWLVGVGFDQQQLGAIAPQPWDVPCDAIVTPTTTLLREAA